MLTEDILHFVLPTFLVTLDFEEIKTFLWDPENMALHISKHLFT